jgi:hypothetical protein
MKPHNKTGRAEKERYRKTTKLKRRKAPTAARGRGSSAADLVRAFPALQSVGRLKSFPSVLLSKKSAGLASDGKDEGDGCHPGRACCG